jgi:TolA-binding protein
VVLAVIFGVVRAAGRFVRATQEDMDHATTQLRAGIQASNSGAEPNPQDEINRRATALQQAAERDFVAAAARAKAGDPQAIDALEAFRTNHPKSPHRQDATFLLGQAQVAAGRFADARFELDAFLLAAPSDPRAGQAQLLRASVDEAAGAFDEALRHLQAVSASSSDPALLTEAFARQAQVYERKGDVPTAISRWREVQTRTAATEPLHVKAQEALDRLVGH